MNAAARLTEPGPTRTALAPMGVPIRRGRLHLGRLRRLLETADTVTVAAGFGTACWLGPAGTSAPNLGRLAYRGETTVDDRGQVVLDLRIRAWLAVAVRWVSRLLRFPQSKMGYEGASTPATTATARASASPTTSGEARSSRPSSISV